MEDIEWGEFKVGDLFEVRKGKRLPERVLDSTKGNIALINQSTQNNMIARYSGLQKSNEIYKKNSITFAVNTKSFGYQTSDFYTIADVLFLKSDFLNAINANYFISTIKKHLPTDGWNKIFGLTQMQDLSIQLPIRDNQIDFHLINNIISNIEKVRIDQLQDYLVTNGLNDYELTANEHKAINEYNKLEWSEFKLETLFQKLKTKKLPYKAKELPKEPINEYILPCLTSSFNNQGLNYFAPKDNATILKNVISIPSNSDVYRAYFQSNDFTVLSDSYSIQWIFNKDKLNPNQYLFAVQCINKVTDLPIYSYKNKLGGWNVVKDKYIKLPVKNDQPDYAVMNKVVSAIKKTVIKDVVKYTNDKLSN